MNTPDSNFDARAEVRRLFPCLDPSYVKMTEREERLVQELEAFIMGYPNWTATIDLISETRGEMKERTYKRLDLVMPGVDQ